MDGIRLYNNQTERHRQYLAAVMHQIISHQYPDAEIIEPSDTQFRKYINIKPEGTEHLFVKDHKSLIYARSYLAVSTSPEAGINRRLNRIVRLYSQIQEGSLERIILALGIECPRACQPKVLEISESLGEKSVQFEVWEAKDVRLQIKAWLSIICPSLYASHLEQLINRSEFQCNLLPAVMQSSSGSGGKNRQSKNTSDDLGTLFVSHASEDKPFVDKLVEKLDRFAKRVWYDKREIIAGDRITDKINQGLTEATAIIAVLSPHSVSKPWVMREMEAGINMQISEQGTSVIPILAKKCDIPPLLKDIRYADFTESFQKGFNQLLTGLQGLRKSFQPGA